MQWPDYFLVVSVGMDAEALLVRNQTLSVCLEMSAVTEAV